MTRQRVKITKKNYGYARSSIEYLIHTYEINAEKWVIDLFNKISVNSTQKSRAELEDWIVTYLSGPVHKKICSMIKKGGFAETNSILLGTSTLEALAQFGEQHNIRSFESIIKVLLENQKIPRPHETCETKPN